MQNVLVLDVGHGVSVCVPLLYSAALEKDLQKWSSKLSKANQTLQQLRAQMASSGYASVPAAVREANTYVWTVSLPVIIAFLLSAEPRRLRSLLKLRRSKRTLLA